MLFIDMLSVPQTVIQGFLNRPNSLLSECHVISYLTGNHKESYNTANEIYSLILS